MVEHERLEPRREVPRQNSAQAVAGEVEHAQPQLQGRQRQRNDDVLDDRPGKRARKALEHRVRPPVAAVRAPVAEAPGRRAVRGPARRAAGGASARARRRRTAKRFRRRRRGCDSSRLRRTGMTASSAVDGSRGCTASQRTVTRISPASRGAAPAAGRADAEWRRFWCAPKPSSCTTNASSSGESDVGEASVSASGTATLRPTSHSPVSYTHLTLPTKA